MSSKRLKVISMLIGMALLFTFGLRYVANRYTLYDYGPDALHHAVMLGDLDKVDTLLSLGASPNKKNEKGAPPLLLAFNAQTDDRQALVTLLLMHGANPDQLGRCLSEKNTMWALQLLEAGADPNYHSGGESILAAAGRVGNEQVVQLLVEFGAKIGPWEAVHMRDVSVLEGILKKRPRTIDAHYVLERTLLMAAISLDDVPLVQFLLGSGADPNLRDYMSNTALHYAVTAKNAPAIIQLLVEHGADPTVRDAHGQLPIYFPRWAKPEDFDASALLLINAGTPMNAADAWGRTPLFTIVQFASPSVLQKALQVGANPNHRNGGQYTPIFSASAENVSTLVAAGADPNVFSSSGETPLYVAVFDYQNSRRTRQMDVEKIKALLAAGALPNLAREGEKSVWEEALDRSNGSFGLSGTTRYQEAIQLMEESFQESPESPVQP